MRSIRYWLTILIGGVVLVAGLALMPLPGPGGLPVTIAGLVILSSELPWARWLLRRLKQRLRSVSVKHAGAARWLNGLALIVGLVLLWIIGAMVVWRVWAS